MSDPASLAENIEAYKARKAEMEKHHKGKHVVFYDREFIDAFDDFSNAAEFAVAKYGRGPYMIRQVGEDTVRLPSSVMYRMIDA